MYLYKTVPEGMGYLLKTCSSIEPGSPEAPQPMGPAGDQRLSPGAVVGRANQAQVFSIHQPNKPKAAPLPSCAVAGYDNPPSFFNSSAQ